LAVNGRDLIEAGVPQGTQIGVILNKLMNMVLDDEAANDREVLLEIARKLI
jgi:tRNA nucleotidyltransferase (CCA-adding enzyme)